MAKANNGCGPEGVLGKVIPDHLLGASIVEPCKLHDEGYSQGGGNLERKQADDLFLKNMLLQIELKKGHVVLKLVRKIIAYTYYYSVRVFGGFLFGK